MLIELKIKNFLSFKEESRITTHAANITEYQNSNTFIKYHHKYLKSLAIFGPNASGKSNLLKAVSFLKFYTKNSYKLSLDELIPQIIPFKLSTTTENKPSVFEITFIHEGSQFRYGFSIDREKVHKEWLYINELTPSSREKLLFIRNGEITLGPTLKSWGIKKVPELRRNVLLFTKLAMDFDKFNEKVFSWFNQLNIIHGHDRSYGSYTRNEIEDNPDLKSQVLHLMQDADIPIYDLIYEKTKVDPEDIPEQIIREMKGKTLNVVERIDILTKHKKFNSNNKQAGTVMLSLEENESRGTNQLFNLLGPIIDTITKNKILFVDEIDSSLHPHLVNYLVSLFNSKQNVGAQLFFTTHDIMLLDYGKLRRDQILFSELDKYGASHVYSLAEFKDDISNSKVRKDANYLRQYYLGRFGAIPLVNEPES